MVEQMIIDKHLNLMKSSLKQDILQKHNRVFSCEFGINAKNFFNLYQKFFYSGDVVQSLRLINPKHFVGVGFCKIDLPTERDPKHHISVNVMSQNDLKKNVGLSLLTLVDHFQINNSLTMKNGLKFKQGELGHFITFQKQFFNNQFALKASNDMDLAKPRLSPSFGFTSRQLNQYIL